MPMPNMSDFEVEVESKTIYLLKPQMEKLKDNLKKDKNFYRRAIQFTDSVVNTLSELDDKERKKKVEQLMKFQKPLLRDEKKYCLCNYIGPDYQCHTCGKNYPF